MKVHNALRWSAPSQNIALLFAFQIVNINSSFFLVKTQECVVITLMSFSSHKFISAVSDECSLFQKWNNLLPCCSAIKTGVFSWLCCKLNKKKNDVKDTSQVTSCFLRHSKQSKLNCRNIYRNMFRLVLFSTSNKTCFGCDALIYIFISH